MKTIPLNSITNHLKYIEILIKFLAIFLFYKFATVYICRYNKIMDTFSISIHYKCYSNSIYNHLFV